jgi:hypothetical protein
VTDHQDGTYTATLTAGTVPETAEVTGTLNGIPIADTAIVEFLGSPITAGKTAQGRLTEEFAWTIEKSVTPELMHLFRRDTGTARFTVTATRTGSTMVTSVVGEVCITNDGATPTAGLTIVDRVQTRVAGGDFQDVPGAVATIIPEVQVGPGETNCYPYEVVFAPVSGASYRNVAHVTVTNFPGNEGEPFGPRAVAPFTLPSTPTGEAYRSITVEDSNGESWVFDGSGSQTYERTYACDADGGRHVNTASIVDTGQSAEAAVTVECHALAVSKTATTSYEQIYWWNLAKTSATEAFVLPLGYSTEVEYTVSVSADLADRNATVSGVITVENPAPIPATIVAVGDTVTGGIGLPVTCEEVEFPLTLVAGGSLTCSYAGALMDIIERQNVATALLQNVRYDGDGTPTEAGTSAFTGTTDITFGEPDAVLDTCVDVTDDQAGALGTVCVGDLPASFTYPRSIGPFDACGTQIIDNTASFTTQDTQDTGSDTRTVTVTVPCGQTCTSGYPYWKSHSEFGPMPYDSAWGALPNGAETPFFDTGQTWLEALQTQPEVGNPYYTLARQYIAAWLNGLRGADVSIVAADIERAAELLDRHDGDPETSETITGEILDEFLALASRLSDYNSGAIGPGSCEEGQ